MKKYSETLRDEDLPKEDYFKICMLWSMYHLSSGRGKTRCLNEMSKIRKYNLICCYK